MLAPRSIATRTGVTVLVLAASVAAAAPPSLVWEPDPTREGSGWIEGDGWIDEGPGYSVNLRLVGEAERLAYLERVTGHPIDPFATPPDRTPRYLSFLLELTNAGTSPLMLEAQTAWLYAGMAEVLKPIGIEGLSSSARIVELNIGEAYQRARPAVLENSITVPPGGTVSGLLVYRRFKPDTKRFRIEMQFTLPSGEMARFIAPYRVPRKTKGDKSK